MITIQIGPPTLMIRETHDPSDRGDKHGGSIKVQGIKGKSTVLFRYY